jgi:ribonuclease R
MIEINDILEGKISANASGSAYLVSPDLPKDIYLHEKNTNKAFHLDKVKIKVIESKDSTRKLEGQVIEILERFKTEFVGVIQISKNFAFFVPDSRKLSNDFFIPKDKLLGAVDGQKVIVRLTEWKDDAKNPNGEVIRILGNAGEHETEIHSILEEYGLPYDFEEDVLAEARAIPIEIPQAEIDKRRDMRFAPTFTIDPKDAKDFDDAISVEWIDGELEVGIHIADVSHYLRPDTELDKEAYARGTSVYLVDRCVPMLPENLSNGLCSLRPLEDKLCFSAVFRLDQNGKVLDEWFGKTVICSSHRFTYEDAQEIIEGGENDLYNKMKESWGSHKGLYHLFAKEIIDGIRNLNKLAKKMRKARQKTGALSFDKQEVKFDLDENNKPVGIKFKTTKDSNKLIEEFMLLANKQVAQFINKKQLPNVNRSHDKPNEAKLEALRVFIKQFGYDIQTNTPEETTKSLNELLNSVQGTPEADMIDNLVVRTMQKATYSTKNIGHYGLGFKDYSHFTSPIRRYPDVIIHRLLGLYLDTERVSKTVPKLEKLEGRCVHLSEREKKAQKAERDSIKYMQCVYLTSKIGCVLTGVISSVTDFGIYVQLEESHADGLIKINNLSYDWSLDLPNYCLKNKVIDKKYRLGDKVHVVINSVDVERRYIDLVLLTI